MPRLQTTAVHEAGHAVMALCERKTFSHVSGEASGKNLGGLHDTRVQVDRDDHVRVLLAGVMAERLSGRTRHSKLMTGAEDDLIGVGNYYREHEKKKVLINFNLNATQLTLVENWNAVEVVARALSRWKGIEYDEVHALPSAPSSLPGKTPPGVIAADTWTPLRERIVWHIENPGGVDGFFARLDAS